MRIPYKYQVALTAALALFMAVLDTTIVNVALTAMERDFGTTINSIQWVITGYTLVQAAVIPVTGYLGNRYGIKRMFIIALVIFTLGSLFCGLSPHLSNGTDGLALLIAFRLLQGIGGGMLFPLGASLAFSVFSPVERGAASAVVSIPVLFAPALGPTVGGLIVDSTIKWPGIFFINVPIGIITVLLIARIVKQDEKVVRQSDAPRFDISGLVLSMVGVVMVVYSFVLVGQTRAGSITPQNPNGIINGWNYWLVWTLLSAGIALLTLFAVLELRVIKDPVLDLRLFATGDFRIASFMTWVLRAVVFGSFLLVPLFLQQFRGLSAIHTGLILFAQGIGSIIGIQFGSRLYDRIGPRYLVFAGLVVLTAATVLLVGIKPNSDWQFFVPILFLRGIGFGWSNLPLQTVSIASITGRALPKATSLYNATAQVFSSIGTAVVTTILVQRTASEATALVSTAQAAGQPPPADLALLAGTAATSDVFRLLVFGTLAASVFCFFLPRYSLKQLEARKTAATDLDAPMTMPQIGQPAFATAMASAPGDTSRGATNGFAHSPLPERVPYPVHRTAPASYAPAVRDDTLSVANAATTAPAFPPAASPPGIAYSSQAAATPASFSPELPQNDTYPDAIARTRFTSELARYMESEVAPLRQAYDARIASLEQTVAWLTEQLAAQQAASPLDAHRLASIEQNVVGLEDFARSLPSAQWHHTVEQRNLQLEGRVGELEQLYRRLTWEATVPQPVPNGASQYGYASPND